MHLTVSDEAYIKLAIDGELYSSAVIYKCFYWFGDKYVVDILFDKETVSFEVTIRPKDGKFGPEDVERLTEKVKCDLIDFKTREIIIQETRNIREILVAKAFAHGDEFDETPPGEISDPVGFDPRDF